MMNICRLTDDYIGMHTDVIVNDTKSYYFLLNGRTLLRV